MMSVARALHVMRSASVNDETLSQLDVHSRENTHISLPQAL